MTTIPSLRHDAQHHADSLPPLLAEAQHLAASVTLGAHGRRHVGAGEEFWQYRNAHSGDSLRSIDWRRSARGDSHYIRQMEWQAAQSVLLWIDGAQSMEFSGASMRGTKGARATVLGLACAILLSRAGERAGLVDDPRPPRTGEGQIDRMAAQLLLRESAEARPDYGLPGEPHFPTGSRAVFLSDFLGDWPAIAATISRAADRGVTGVLLQVLDPIEEEFPFDGRTEFRSMSGALKFETLRARGLKESYLERLAKRKEEITETCRRIGWRSSLNHTSEQALPALLWLYAALEKVR